ncbi:hypothetical protein Chor_001639 [Crotalus horridus]
MWFQRCLQDILDGFFPSELQRRYPNGVPFQVTDKRDVFFRERKLPGYFPGFGQAVGRSKPSGIKETSEISGDGCLVFIQIYPPPNSSGYNCLLQIHSEFSKSKTVV